MLLIAGVMIAFCDQAIAQDAISVWREASKSEFSEKCYLESMPKSYRVLVLDLSAMKTELNRAIYDSDPHAFDNAPIISLPLPEGGFGRFRVARSEVLPDNTQPSFSNIIRTFTAYGIDDKYAVAKFDYTIFGFHAMVMTPTGWFMVEPYSLTNASHYISFYRRDKTNQSNFTCQIEDGEIRRITPTENSTPSVNRTSGTTLKTYRLALACTGEYAAVFGGTQAGALSAMVTSVNRVTGVYELELAVRLVLVSNTNLVYTNSATDPYTNNTGSTMLGENQTNITTIIGTSNYDIGHVFSTGGGGVAGLGVVCNSTNKARGVTGSGSPFGDGFDIDYVAHEMGHQFGGNHTFNSSTGSCGGGNRNASTAYEVGSGSTIMAYAGICGADNTQSNSDPIFHVKSYDEIQTYITTGGGTCFTGSATGNIAPVITIPGNYSIPISTPFSLTGSATDANGDAMTYIWEEYDLGAASTVTATQTTGSTFPLFRDFTPTTSGTRIFPKISDIVNNTSTVGERLPSVARTMNFRFTTRDNRLNGGGVTNNDTPVQVAIVLTSAPFVVTAPNTAVTWTTGSTQTVTWNVVGTTAAPISCANVNIYLSTDGGYTYPYTLATGVPNNGSAVVTVPGVLSSTARVKVEGAGNIFFDISNVNFSIIAGSSTLTTLTTLSIAPTTICPGSVINVGFSGDGPPNPGNVYTAQLSNAAGSFASPTTLGTLSSVATSGTISSTIPVGAAAGTGYLIRVIASNPAITGTTNGANLTIQQTVGAAGAITGSTSLCAGAAGVIYSVGAISNAATYNWALPSGASITSGSGTNSITVTFASNSVSGNITVNGSNSCFSGSTSPALPITILPLPSAAGSIVGVSSVCQGQTISFSVGAISGATTYTWTLPLGGTIASGAGTNSITATFPTAGIGNVTVSGTNSCGNGTSSTTALTVLPIPTTPSIVAGGPTTFCNGGSVNLSFTPVVGDQYQWRKNAANISGAVNSPYNATTSGTYDLISWSSQQYSSASVVAIPDNSCTGGISPIGISGYTGAIASSGISVSINITHTYDADLVIVLQAPNGQILGLANAVGSSGDNFTNSVFTDAGSAQIPATGVPYTGTYKPWTSIMTTTCVTSTITTFGAIGGGSINPNGTWNLLVYDNASIDVGTINNWSITFPASSFAPCYGTSNSINVTVTPAPNISSFTPTSGGVGQAVSISGTGFTNASSVLFNGISAAFSVVNDGLINTTVPAGSTTGLISVITPCGTGTSIGTFTSSVSVVTLNLKVFIEGYYNASGTLNSPLGTSNSDSIDVSLAASAAPHAILFTKRSAINLSGNGSFTFPSTVQGNSYYIVVKHRNSLETWSGSAVPLPSSTNSFDFTTLASQAFGSNQVQVAVGKWAIRSGDVNQDGAINNTDFTLLQSVLTSLSIGYQSNDVTGDNLVESADYSLVETNSQLNYVVLKP